MNWSEKILPFLLFFLYLGIKYEVSGEDCILQNPKDPNKSNLLSSISLLKGSKFLSNSDKYSYVVSICYDFSKGKHPNASVTRTFIANSTTTVLGRYNETDIIGIGEQQMLLTYSGGDKINDSSTCNNSNWKTLIVISCNEIADEINIDLLDPYNGGCFALFHLKTSVCVPARKSAFLTWLLVIFVIIVAYFVCGIIYKRYSEGAKGWEQVPHHEFWRNPLQHLMGCLRGKDDIQIQRSEPNDPADEPLLRS
ncbi:cation-dependent mannose-6-phosphate receptor [Halyomorpha halys]|uniref:cation-dependent mannose-6-phosphate receptor n=1 Tax=Halyomorpha halys TaxID=286706 RepID=UPI0006D4DB59|nr:cation-dependent mannose-6-phosphate receptor-like [Halyomorpha halys]